MKRSALRFITRAIVVILLLAQWSIASHACTLSSSPMQVDPGSARSTDRVAAGIPPMETEVSPMIDCASMDGMSAALQDPVCSEHCSHGDQGDRSPSSAVPPPVLSLAYYLTAAAATGPTRQASAQIAHALALGSLSHTILHCVRRT